MKLASENGGCSQWILTSPTMLIPFHTSAGVRGSCDFEGNWQKVCGWRQADDDDTDWSLGQMTPAPGTGPQADHTIGRGG